MKKALVVIAATVVLVVIAAVAVSRSGDDTRRQGALGSEDAVTLSWHGEWSEEQAYGPGSVVRYEGESYVAEAEKLSTPNPECSDCGWTRLAVETAAVEPAKEEAPPVPVVRGYEQVTATHSVLVGSGGSYFVSCPEGKMPLNGGMTSAPTYLTVVGGGLHSVKTDANGVQTGTWAVAVQNTGQQRDQSFWAICAFVD